MTSQREVEAELDVAIAQYRAVKESAERLCKRLEAPVEDGLQDGQASPSGSEPGRVLSSLASQRMALRTMQGGLLAARSEAEHQAKAFEKEIAAIEANESALRQELFLSRQKAEAKAAVKAAAKEQNVNAAVQTSERDHSLEEGTTVDQSLPSTIDKLASDFVAHSRSSEQLDQVQNLSKQVSQQDAALILSQLLEWRRKPSERAAYQRREILHELLDLEGYKTEVTFNGELQALDDIPNWVSTVLSQELALQKRREECSNLEEKNNMLRKLNRLSAVESEGQDNFLECNDLLHRLSSQQREILQATSAGVSREIESALPSVESKVSTEEKAMALVAEIKRLRQEDQHSTYLGVSNILVAEYRTIAQILHAEKAASLSLDHELARVRSSCDQLHAEMQRHGVTAPSGSLAQPATTKGSNHAASTTCMKRHCSASRPLAGVKESSWHGVSAAQSARGSKVEISSLSRST